MTTNANVTLREKEVLQLIPLEYSMIEIASRLCISHHTVISHRKRLLKKLDAKNTAGMMRKAFEHGILRLRVYH